MAAKVLNFNVGVLGHVDSGKTSLCKALSTVASTASFDKNPQSKERGITLDLGFSSFTVEISPAKREELEGFSGIQYTLVDCPGHASLIRTIIGGAQIIDLMMLVIDITKGMQTQTAECLVIGEITCSKMVVVLNKLDMISADKQITTVDKMKKRLWKTLENTKFAECPIVAVSARPGGPETPEAETVGINDLITTMQDSTFVPLRSEDGPFIFSADHCFSIRGQGTVMTGTVLSGKVTVSDTVDIPSLRLNRKVKSMQMFRKPVEKIKQGDRAGICVTQFDPTQLERGLVCSHGAVVTTEAVIISIKKISYYKGQISTKAKFHITLGHETVMGRISLFGLPQNKDEAQTTTESILQRIGKLDLNVESFDFSKEYVYQEELISLGKRDTNNDVKAQAEDICKQFALIELERPVACTPHALVIGSRLDADVHTGSCRVAFCGKILEAITDIRYRETVLPNVKVFKMKTKEGQVERATDKYSVIVRSLFKKETNIAAFANLKVGFSTGEKGVIEGAFGQSGKVKVRVPEGLNEETFQRYSSSGKKKGKGKGDEPSSEEGSATSDSKEAVKIYLQFKRYIYDPKKIMTQS